MQSREAILAFSQSEKIKAGLIWASQLVEMAACMPQTDRTIADRMLGAAVGMVGNDIHIGKTSAPHPLWADIEKNVDLALVMINSGVATEASFHLSRALRQVTTIGQKAMTFLMDQKLL